MAEYTARVRTEAELRAALARFCDAVWYPTKGVSIFSIPVQDNDADVTLSDGISELVTARAEIARLREGLQRLRQAHAAGLAWGCHDCGATGATGCPAWLEDYPAQFQFEEGACPECTCGADEHNAQLDALLKGGTDG